MTFCRFLIFCSNTKIYLYFCNPSATSASNGPNTFVFFDHFDEPQGWSSLGKGLVVADNTTIPGTSLIAKTTNCDPNGGYKLLGSTLNEFRLISREIRLNEGGTSCSWNRYGVEDANLDGYNIRRNADSANNSQPFGYERRNGGSASNASQINLNHPRESWFRTELRRCDATTNNITAVLYDDERSVIGTVNKTDQEVLSWAIEILNPTNSNLIETDGCGVCWIDNGTSTYFFNPNTEYIAAVVDEATDNIDLGNTEVCVFVDDEVNTCQNNPYLERHWSVDPDMEENACIKLFFTLEELNSLAASIPGETVDGRSLVNNSRLCLTAWSGGNESCGDFESEIIYSMAASPPLVVMEEDLVKEIWSVEVCTNKFATFFLNVCEYPLPVELIYFRGEKVEEDNLLSWKTASEFNTSHFELERSANGSDFDFLAKIEAVGNSNQIFTQQVFYETNLVNADELEVIIFDITGQVAHYQHINLGSGTHKLEFNLHRLPPGSYFFKTNLKALDVSERYKLVKYR